jgi:hypothetical protein
VNDKWFANRGQAIQTLLALIACIFAGVKAFPDFRRTEFFTIGSLLFIFLVALVVVSIGQLGLTFRREYAKSDKPDSSATAKPEVVPFSEQYRGKIFSCSSGLSHIGKRADGVWTSVGPVSAAIATFRNESGKPLRNVKAYVYFYDAEGHQISFCLGSWVDEEHDNTAFAQAQTRSLVVAIHAKDTDMYFSIPDGQRLKEGNIAVTLRLSVDSIRHEEIQFNLSTVPYFGLTPVKPQSS